MVQIVERCRKIRTIDYYYYFLSFSARASVIVISERALEFVEVVQIAVNWSYEYKLCRSRHKIVNYYDIKW